MSSKSNPRTFSGACSEMVRKSSEKEGKGWDVCHVLSFSCLICHWMTHSDQQVLDFLGEASTASVSESWCLLGFRVGGLMPKLQVA